MRCPHCAGGGTIYVICALRTDGFGGPAWIPCPDCHGTGDVEGYWPEAGEALRKARMAADRSLREEARRLGISAVELSRRERGLVNPESWVSARP